MGKTGNANKTKLLFYKIHSMGFETSIRKILLSPLFFESWIEPSFSFIDFFVVVV